MITIFIPKKNNVVPPNTFIGGKSATFTSASDLETFLGLSSGDVQYFTIIGSDIECRITANYTLPTLAFNGDTSITWYRDLDGRCTASAGTNHFVGCTNLDEIIFNGVMTNSPVCKDNGTISNIIIPNCTIANGFSGQTITGLVDISSATTLNPFLFLQSIVNRVKFNPIITSVLTSAFRESEGLKYLDLSHLTTISSTALYDLDNTEIVIDLRGLATCNFGGLTRFSTHLRKMFLHNATEVSLSPNNTNRPKHYVISKATKIGAGTVNYSLVTNNFLLWTTPSGGGKIYVHPSMATINAGAPSADMVLLASQGFTIVYVTDYTAPDEVTDLTASNITGTTFDLNFTTPTAVNGFQHLDVYIDFGDGFVHIFDKEVTTSGGTVTIGSGYSGQTLQVKCISVDNFYNMSDFSNQISVAIP